MYVNDWSESKHFGMVADFEGNYISESEFLSDTVSGYLLERKAEMQAALLKDEYKGLDMLLASYTYEDYSGSAFVLFKKDGKLWEVNGSHGCSCYGLEGQWEPEECTPESLLVRRWDECDGVTKDMVVESLRRGGYSVEQQQ